MEAQTPAEGIMKTHEWSDSKMYKVVCGCGQPYHEHNVDIEADESGVNINVYVTVKTDYWSDTLEKRYDIDNQVLQELDWFFKDLINGLIRRLKLSWELWTTGAITSETTIALTPQQAINYAEILKSAVNDVDTFRKKRTKK